MINTNLLEVELTKKLQHSDTKFIHEDDTYLFLKDSVMDIKVTKEISQDRHKIEIKESNTDESFGFYGTVLNSFVSQ